MRERSLDKANTALSGSRPSTLGACGQERGPPGLMVIGIGASAGGLEACTKLIAALPAGCGMAFILVQHLHPTHESMMVDLLAGHTSLTVRQATHGMPLEREHFYLIPPGVYLALHDGCLHLSQPEAPRGARLPFDFLLRSLAEEFGSRAICVILSGTGADGSVGLKAVQAEGGLIIAQDPLEAGYDGMPRSAIATGAVDLVLEVADIPGALVAYQERRAASSGATGPLRHYPAQPWLAEIVEVLRTKTTHDFRLYKPGTLQRRIDQRMAMAGIAGDDPARYLAILRDDAGELDRLAQDLLINVTSFFRDPAVFDVLAQTVIPELIRSQPPHRPLRIWIAGCSTGEEPYSLVMLFREQITAAKLNLKLQIFASDVDPDAVAFAREGLYPDAIEADLSPARIARFFAKEGQSYRVLPELRAAVVFTVQDILADPPFSRLDLVSCRNLLIYLRPEAQATVMAHFHFALREGGVLLLGSSETVSQGDGRFEMIEKAARLYRHVGRGRLAGSSTATGNFDRVMLPARQMPSREHSRQAALAELCRRLVAETYEPAAVLVNEKAKCLFSLGPTDRYLRVAPGLPSDDLLAMAREGVQGKLRSALEEVGQKKTRIVVGGGRISHNGQMLSFSIAVQPVVSKDEELLLICFVDEPTDRVTPDRTVSQPDASRVTELEQELEATRADLQGAIRNLEIASDEQRTINEEAFSVNEEYQSANEELITSKEELQSLNEELIALNSQLQETLERQRTTSNDLQNVLYSTDVATLFLDTSLSIRFFTPTTKSLFSVIPGDLGRPLADLNSLTSDSALLNDAQAVLQSSTPLEREIEARSGAWYLRRILPYRTQDKGVEGVVITFSDITERRRIAEALGEAKRQAEQASLAKSRFLAAASHNLRQPLQTLALLQGLLAKTVAGGQAQNYVARLDDTLDTMSTMLNALLDINQIEAGVVRAEAIHFPLNSLLDRLRDEFTYHARAQALDLRVVGCGLLIHSDPRLLEQMIRNLLSNALKYTRRGKVLLGCRRHRGMLGIEIWDTGVGIPEAELQAIFEEYHQLDNVARERTRGLGLGLSIVQRLGNLLGHRVKVRSFPGRGSVFTIEVGLLRGLNSSPPRERRLGEKSNSDVPVEEAPRRTGLILIVEDDPELRNLLELLLQGEGHRTSTAADGVIALDLVTRERLRPDLLLSDYLLPNGVNGLQLTAKLREMLHRRIPVIILTGDISTDTLRDIALQSCIQLNKPVTLKELSQTIQDLLPSTTTAQPHQMPASRDLNLPVIFVVDDDNQVRAAIRAVLEDDGRIVEDYGTSEAFLEAYRPGGEACLLVDAYLPGMSGLELLRRLRETGHWLPAVMITGSSDVPMAVEAMKAGATDFIEKPIGARDLLASIERALDQARDSSKLAAWRETAASHVACLTVRQRQIMELVLAGHPSKNIAADLGISQRTVENHRASIMKKTGARSLPALARLALTAAWNGVDEPQGPLRRQGLLRDDR